MPADAIATKVQDKFIGAFGSRSQGEAGPNEVPVREPISLGGTGFLALRELAKLANTLTGLFRRR